MSHGPQHRARAVAQREPRGGRAAARAGVGDEAARQLFGIEQRASLGGAAPVRVDHEARAARAQALEARPLRFAGLHRADAARAGQQERGQRREAGDRQPARDGRADVALLGQRGEEDLRSVVGERESGAPERAEGARAARAPHADRQAQQAEERRRQRRGEAPLQVELVLDRLFHHVRRPLARRDLCHGSAQIAERHLLGPLARVGAEEIRQVERVVEALERDAHLAVTEQLRLVEVDVAPLERQGDRAVRVDRQPACKTMSGRCGSLRSETTMPCRRLPPRPST